MQPIFYFRFNRAFLPIFICTAMLTLAACNGGKNKLKNVENFTVEELYERASNNMANGNYESAIQFFQQLEAKFPYGKYADQAQLDIAYAYYKNGDSLLAVAAVERFLRLHPAHPSVDYAYYLKGLSSFIEDASLLGRLSGQDELSDRDAKRANTAFDAFRDLIIRYPDSRYADDARQRMTYLLNTLARHEVAVADYYMRRGAWVAVVNRAKYIIENYQNTPAVEDALGLMLTAYEQMGLQDLRSDTVRVLRINFPSSPYLASLN